jgi:hypothetical protein
MTAPSPPASVRVTVTVTLDPASAFDVFTTEIDEWYRRGVTTLGSPDSKATLCFEPGVGGRLIESRPGRDDVERARVTVWAPGERLVFVDTRQTEVEVRFEPVDSGTRVVLEHRGLERLSPGKAIDVSKFGWRRLATWFETYVETRTEENES